ncbi:MAG: patatin-like phospholipase family protein [Pseudomonadota bacterium]
MLFEDVQLRAQAPEYRRRAKSLLHASKVSREEIDSLSKVLLDLREWSYARRLLARARGRVVEDPKARLELAQRQALATYNDTELPVDARLEGALAILEERCGLKNTRNQRTLSLAGAVFKRRWRLDGHKENLERALTYYLRAYEEGPEHDLGQSGINAAFVLDQLGDVERREAASAGGSSDMAAARAEETQAIREELVETLSPLIEATESVADRWRLYTTIAEALFGLGQFEQAGPWLEKLRELGVSAWQYQATVRQLASVARMQSGDMGSVPGFSRSQAGKVLREFLREHSQAVRGAYAGRVGLALSGGGFRAALYHIGVLARLAELDVLRHVEVLSCVAGGAIVGTHYYLLLKELLESKADAEIAREDYIALVRRLERHFQDGVRRNLRGRLNIDPVTNAKLLGPTYNRTMRTGELLEEMLFSRVAEEAGQPQRRRGKRDPLYMPDLAVRPYGTAQGATFEIKHDNWRRAAKVPELVINATTLNTGHNWQFTADSMGEPPGSINTHVDSSYQLRRVSYAEAPEGVRSVRLGYAVAASAAVPGRTEPLSLKGLYPGVDVRLVDGGVQDTQGISALLERDCQVMLVSDGTGPIDSVDAPSIGRLAARRRANIILRARALQLSTEHLEGRRRSGLLRGLMFVHLRKDLPVTPIDWVGCDDPLSLVEDRAQERVEELTEHQETEYEIPIAIQRALAAVRTDYDAFHESESLTLMLSGYRMAEHAFREDSSLTALTDGEAPSNDWDFLAVQDALRDYAAREHLREVLAVSARRRFKPWLASERLRQASWIAGIGAAALAAIVGAFSASAVLLNGAGAVLLLLATVVAIWVGRRLSASTDLPVMVGRLVYGLWAVVTGPITGRAQLWLLDRLYLRFGRLKPPER